MLQLNFFLLIFVKSTIILSINGFRILFIPAHNINSHIKSMYPLAELLADEGHEAVMLQLLRPGYTNETCVGRKVVDRYIWAPPIPEGEPIDDEAHSERLWTSALQNPKAMYWPWVTAARVCKDILNDREAGKMFMDISREHWDLIVVDDLFASCGILTTAMNSASWIVLSTTFLQYTRVLELKKVKPPPSYVPGMRTLGVFDPTSFYHRLWSTLDLYIIIGTGYMLDYYLPVWMTETLEYAGSVSHFQEKSSFAMGVMPPELDFGKPLSNDIIDYDNDCPDHIAELPEPYLSFVEDDKSRGTILFSVGHYVDWDFAPPAALKAFEEAFAELTNYRIVWQFVSTSLRPSVGKHVLAERWIPQIPLLSHNKTVLFISHGGLKSLEETLCFGVPMIGMAMFAEQPRNTAVAAKKGFGIYLDKTNLNKETVLNAILTILNNSSYKANVQKMNNFLRDKIINPRKLAKFWMSFALKHDSKAVQRHTRQNRPDCFIYGENYDILLLVILLVCASTNLIR